MVHVGVWGTQVYATHRCMVHADVWYTVVYGAHRCMVHTGVWGTQVYGAHASVWGTEVYGTHRRMGRLLALPLGFSGKKVYFRFSVVWA